jgi:aspartyl-tRNA(Asn)/glutamyl-tRNA(Gln) amidotransferase subunit C
MAITKEQVEYVAKLARLNLKEEEKEKLTVDMAQIIDFADKLNSLNTEGIEPTAHILPINNVTRKDEVKPSYDRDAITENAPSKQDGCYKIAKVVE